MLILGLNAYHGDSAACLLQDGRIIAAAEEERFRRIKHWAGLPTHAINFCLQEVRATFSDLDHIAINRKPGVNNWRRALFVLRHRPDLGLIKNRIRNIRQAVSVEETLTKAFPGHPFRARVHHVEHHLAHLASAFYVSTFPEAVCLSVDGFGDFASAAWGMGWQHSINVDGRVYFPHSLGIFYSAITQLIGFPWFGDEYKVMGLAPYGQPKCLDKMRKIVRIQSDGTYRLGLEYFRHHNENVSYTWNDCAPEVGTLYTPALEELLSPARKKEEPLEQHHRDIARSAQAMYEEAFFALLNALHRRYNCPNLALAGGCAMNSVANGKVYLSSPFRRMYLPAAAGDAGGAIGAALATWHSLSTLNSQPSTSPMPHAYVGPQFSDAEIESLLRSRSLLDLVPERIGATQLSNPEFPISNHPAQTATLLTTNAPNRGNTTESQVSNLSSQPSTPLRSQVFSLSLDLDSGFKFQPSDFSTTCFSDSVALCQTTARAIAVGKVVGWFQGRMEWGPRALGNRSILGDPRRTDMKDILNAKIKRRESFRPFAPSILRQPVDEWFEQTDDVPFMMQVFQVREEKRKLVPATTHVDGSGRLQTVHRETNPLYHQLITEFERITGVPMVLNTSFNENEPVVCKPEEALDCFLRTKMDALVLGSFFLERLPAS